MSTTPRRRAALVVSAAAGAVGSQRLIAGNTLTLAAVVQLVAGVITSKLAATLLGPAGVGVYALVQAVANIVALCALGTGEALVREWGRRRDVSNSSDFAAMLRGAELAGLAALAVVAVGSLLLSRPLSAALFGDSTVDPAAHRETFLLAVASGIAFAWVTVQVNSMVARQRVLRVSLALALAAASTPAVAWFGFRAWGVDGIGRVQFLAMVASLVTTAVVATVGTGLSATATAPLREAAAEIPALLRYGIPHVLGTLFTAAMLLIVPIVVGATQGVDAAGFYRAAATIAAGMATLFTFELNGDFSARIARAAGDPNPNTFRRMTRTQLRRLLLRGVAVVALLSLTAPVIVPILYDTGFDPTIRLLPLILLGQLLGLVAMTLNIGIGARFGGGWMLLNATIGGIATVLAVAAVDSLPGVGITFVAGQAIFLLTCVAGGRHLTNSAPVPMATSWR